MGLIQLDDLYVRLGKRMVLNGLTCELRGRAIGLLGPNGAGKSTLIQTLLGFYLPEKGTARIFDMDIHSQEEAIRSHIGYMPENDSFIGNMSGLRYVRYMAELSGIPANKALERAHEAMFFVGLGEVRYRKITTYSLGMKQLVKLAQALAPGPRLLILDEPTNGLDPIARQRMVQLIRDIRDAGEVSLLISSHLLRDIDDTCDEVLILKEGRVAAHSDLAAERSANRSFIELETVGVTEPFAVAVRSLGCECAEYEGGRLKMVIPEQVKIQHLYAAAAQAGVQIRRMNQRRDSLEDIFLKAMYSEWEAPTNVSL